MVFRVTNQAQQSNVLNNIFRISEDLFNAQKELASGKRVLKPSDDPSGIRDILSLRTSIKQTNQLNRNIDNARVLLSNTDAALESIGDAIQRAKELNLQQIGGSATPQTRSAVATEINQLIESVLQSANTRSKQSFIFAGTKTRTMPFSVDAFGGVYNGNSDAIFTEIDRNSSTQINLPGSEVLGTDLNPILSSSTLISTLNGGSGVPAGSFTITDRGGSSGTVNITSGMTVDQVISAINSAGVNVTASLNANQNGLQLTDTSTVVTQALTVTEVSGGTTAENLGILGQRNGNMTGRDLNAQVTAGTLLSELNGGNGLSLTSINIVTGSASGAVSLSSANTVGDVINTINSSAFNVTAGINSLGNSLQIVSNDSSFVAIVSDVGNGTTAQDLGLGGGRNVLTTLVQLREALLNDDTSALIGLINNLDKGVESVSNSRAINGSILRRLDSTEFVHEQENVNEQEQLTNIEEIDFAQKASEIAGLELAFEATLNTSARILQPSLLDFLA